MSEKDCMKEITFKLRDDYITLGQLLKATDLVDEGYEAKLVIQDGQVKVNGEIDTRRGKKMRDGDIAEFNGVIVRVTA